MAPALSGMGPKLGAEFLVAVGGSLDAFSTADRLAAFGGVAPAPHDSGKTSGNLRRPQRYHRRLRHVFSTYALVSSWCDPNSKRFYDRESAEGKSTEAALAGHREAARLAALFHTSVNRRARYGTWSARTSRARKTSSRAARTVASGPGRAVCGGSCAACSAAGAADGRTAASIVVDHAGGSDVGLLVARAVPSHGQAGDIPHLAVAVNGTA